MNKHLQVFFVTVFFLLSCTSAQANERWFQIEVIVFQQSAPNTELFEQIETELKPVEIYAVASSGKKSLQNIYNRLRRAGGYQPLSYQSWRVPVKSNRISLPVNITDEAANIHGWLKIQRGNLLHVLADIELGPTATIEGDALFYRITEKRRVMLNEVHYLDHPFFGVVLKLSLVE
ncbi:MAG: hypothetical protein GQ581_02050 [Methyloprofundus sp.]|nr:hypothetical protein [Methyloprofundus sp.]